MNGRLYDPVIGRMLSPDNYVQDVTNTQSYNRYSYANNNPLKYTDPTGWFNTATDYSNIIDGESQGGRGGSTPGGWNATMGFHSMFGITTALYGSGTALSAYNTGFGAPGRGFGSAFTGRNWTLKGVKTWQDPYVTHDSYTDQSGLQAQPVFTPETGTLTGNYWISGMDWNTATASLGGSGQYFLSPRGYWRLSGYYFANIFRYQIGKNTLHLNSPELNAFQHLAGYSAMALGGLSMEDLKWRMDEHEKDETGLDTEVDKANNDLVINKYIPALNALNKTFADPYSYSIEIIKLMQAVGYYIGGSNNNPVITFLPQDMAKNLIQILESLKP